MPSDYSLEEGLAVLTTQGNYSPRELILAIDRLAGDERAKDGVYLLIDAREGSLDGTIEEIEAFERRVARTRRIKARSAHVVGDDYHHGLARFGEWEASLCGGERAVFRDFEAAREWLLGADERRGTPSADEGDAAGDA